MTSRKSEDESMLIQIGLEFDIWNNKKKVIHRKDVDPDELYFHEKEIWWCHVGKNIGSETFGKGEEFRRPVLIIKKLSSYSFIGIPLTSRLKAGSWWTDISVSEEVRYCILSQIRNFDVRRLYLKIDEVSELDFNKVKEKLKTLLELP